MQVARSPLQVRRDAARAPEERGSVLQRLSQFARFCAGALLLCASGLVAYFNSLHNGWVWDDNQQIAMNPDLRPGAPLGRAFAGDVWSFQHPGTRGRLNYFRPMQTLTYRLVISLFGLDPFAFHSVNLGFHLLATLLGFAVFWRITSRMVGAFAAAEIFAVHPIHTEAVDWASALPDIGCTAFLALAFLFFIEARSPARAAANARSRLRRIACWAISFLGFSVALLWKETAMVFPLLIAVWMLLFGEASRALKRCFRAITRSSPYWGILALYLLLRFRILGFLAVRQQNWELSPLSFALTVLDLMRSYWWKLLVPFPLNAYYVFSPVKNFVDPRAALAILFALAAGAGIWFAARRAPLVAFSALWVFLTLIPVLNLYGIGHNVFTERYLYLPSLGFCPLMILLVSSGAGWPPASVRKPVAIAALACLLAAFTWLTLRRNPDWKDDATFFTRTLAQSPQAPFLHYMAASLQTPDESGDASAEEHYRQAIALAEKESPPDWLYMSLAYEGLSSVYASRGEMDRALAALDKVRQINPADPEVDAQQGFILEQAGRWDEAEKFVRRAAAQFPENPNVLNALGLLTWQRYHQLEEAAGYFTKAIALHSIADDFGASLHNNLGAVYEIQGKTEDAVREFRTAVAIAPRDPEFQTHLAAALAIQGRLDEARSTLLVTLSLDPGYQPARDVLRRLDSQQGAREP